MNTSQSRINFMGELCKYFMNFLQSGFKSTKYPKRYVRLTNEKNFNKFNKDLKKNKFVNLKYTFHSTSFLPLIPLGLGSFEFKSFLRKNTYPYFMVYLKYLLSRFFLNYNLTKKIKIITNNLPW